MTPEAEDTAPLPALGEPTGRRGDPAWYTRRFELVLYVLAGATYIGFGLFHKWLLNWIVGPIWLIAWVWLVPLVLDRLRRSGAPSEAPR